MIIYGAAVGGSAALGRPPTETEQHIELDTQRQLLVIRNQRLKADAANHEIALMHQQSAQEFLETADHLSTLKEAAKGKDYQALVQEFNQRDAQLVAQHLFGVTEVSARNIGMKTATPALSRREPSW